MGLEHAEEVAGPRKEPLKPVEHENPCVDALCAIRRAKRPRQLPRRKWLLRGARLRDRTMPQPPTPSARSIVGIALILLLIALWAAFVASLAQMVGQWPILVQAAFYL